MPLTIRPFNPARVRPSPTRNLVPLFTDPAWTKHANATVSPDGKTLTLNATANFQDSRLDVPLIPGMRYRISGMVSNGGYIYFRKPPYIHGPDNMANLNPSQSSVEFTVPAGVTTGRLYVGNSRFDISQTYSNLTLTKALPTFAPVKAREFFKELVVNGDFSQGATGWFIHPRASVVGGKLLLDADASSRASTQFIDVAPNTTYTVTWTCTGIITLPNRPRLNAQEYNAAGSLIRNNSNIPVNGDGTYTFDVTTGPTTTKILINCTNDNTGVFTFDNISLKRKSP